METISNKCSNLRLFTLTFSRLIYRRIYTIDEALRERCIWFFFFKAKTYAQTLELNAKWHGMLNNVPRITFVCSSYLRLVFVRFHCKSLKKKEKSWTKEKKRDDATMAKDISSFGCMTISIRQIHVSIRSFWIIYYWRFTIKWFNIYCTPVFSCDRNAIESSA